MAEMIKNPEFYTEVMELPLKMNTHSKFAAILFLLGFLLTCWFFLYVVTFKQNDRRLSREILLALFSSIYLGLGSFFLMLSFGVNI